MTIEFFINDYVWVDNYRQEGLSTISLMYQPAYIDYYMFNKRR
jgi:hypothetical protein